MTDRSFDCNACSFLLLSISLVSKFIPRMMLSSKLYILPGEAVQLLRKIGQMNR